MSSKKTMIFEAVLAVPIDGVPLTERFRGSLGRIRDFYESYVGALSAVRYLRSVDLDSIMRGEVGAPGLRGLDMGQCVAAMAELTASIFYVNNKSVIDGQTREAIVGRAEEATRYLLILAPFGEDILDGELFEWICEAGCKDLVDSLFGLPPYEEGLWSGYIDALWQRLSLLGAVLTSIIFHNAVDFSFSLRMRETE